MRTIWEFRAPWNQHWPLSAGFNFVLFSLGFFRFAGGGYGVTVCVLSATLSVKRWPKYVDENQGQAMSQQSKCAGSQDHHD